MRISPPSPSIAPRRRAVVGFTLVEIMIVVIIIGALAALAIPAISRVQQRTRITRVKKAGPTQSTTILS